jgi:hypothetical protein
LLQALHSQNKRVENIKSPKKSESSNAKTQKKKTKLNPKIKYFVKKIKTLL